MTESPTPSLLKAVYTLDHAPITFDFGVFLALTDCARQLSGRDVVDLTIMAEKYRDITPRDKLMGKAEKDWRLKNIIMDCCELLPTLVNYGVQRQPDGAKEFEFPPIGSAFPYLAKNVLRLFRAGANPRVLKAPEHAKALVGIDRPYVTITIRHSAHFPERNVDLGEWVTFAWHLRDEGFDVIAVPDQEDATGVFRADADDAFAVYPAAALDIRLRLALYEGAVMNFCSSNGPTALMFYTDCPVLQFDQLRGGTFSATQWQALNGFPVGEQFPWSLPTQRMTWTDSTFETLKSEWEKMREATQAA